MLGQEEFGSARVTYDSLTPYSDATRVGADGDICFEIVCHDTKYQDVFWKFSVLTLKLFFLNKLIMGV